jgi:hypothetical protein
MGGGHPADGPGALRDGVALALAVAALSACTGSGGAVSGSAVDGGLVDACADSMAACYSNADCSSASERCSVPTNADPAYVVTCCLPGQRGSGQAGQTCAGPNDCQTAVCAYTLSGPLCSAACATDADCHDARLPSCVIVDGGGSFCGLAP